MVLKKVFVALFYSYLIHAVVNAEEIDVEVGLSPTVSFEVGSTAVFEVVLNLRNIKTDIIVEWYYESQKQNGTLRTCYTIKLENYECEGHPGVRFYKDHLEKLLSLGRIEQNRWTVALKLFNITTELAGKIILKWDKNNLVLNETNFVVTERNRTFYDPWKFPGLDLSLPDISIDASAGLVAGLAVGVAFLLAFMVFIKLRCTVKVTNKKKVKKVEEKADSNKIKEDADDDSDKKNCKF